jgi:hypothetical protein
MTSKRILSVAVTGALFLLVSCGGHDGVELGEFPAIKKTEGDAPFDLVAPSSKSPAPFTFSSSDPAVASIVGTRVTVGVPGTATITAQQGKMGSYYPTSKSTTLTVEKRKGTTINGSTGWRLPTRFELTTLVGSGALAGKQWAMLDTWTSDVGTAAKQHLAVNLSTSGSMSLADESKAYVTCVRGA